MDERLRTQSIVRESEVRHAFLLALGAALRPLADPLEIQATASRVLGEHLAVCRVTYFDVREDCYVIDQDYVSGVESLVGRHPIAAFGGPLVDACHRGHIAVNCDVGNDHALAPAERAAHAALHVRAYIVVPLMKNGRFVVGLAVHSRHPRAWTVEEIGLVEVTAERIWSAVLCARAEEALKQSEERYRTLFTHIDEAFCVAELLYDEEGRPCDRRLLEANARYHALVGAQFSVGTTARMLLPNIDNLWFDRCHEAITTGNSLRFEHHVPQLDRWYDTYVSRVGGEGSRIYAAVFHDTTSRRRREANLQFLSEASRDLVTLNDVAEITRVLGDRIGRHLLVAGGTFAAIDEATGRVCVDHEWRRQGVPGILGQYRLDDFLTDDFYQALRTGREVVRTDVHTDDAGKVAQFVRAGVGSFICVPAVADNAGRFCLFVYCSRPRQWLDEEVDLLRELAGRVGSRLERARADEALRAHQEQLRRSAELLNVIINRSPTGFYIVDADLRISHMNAESQARAFRNVNPAIGRRYEEAMRVLWPEPLATETVERVRHTLETGETYVSPGLIAHRADLGVIECYDWQLERITMPDGRHAVVCYYYDTTRLRQAEQELRVADRRKDEFLATLGHELRNPMAPIRNGLHYFRRMRIWGKEAATVQEMMERQFNHLVRLVDDLLEVSRITRGKVVLRLEQVDLADIIQGAVETSRPLIEERGQQLEFESCGTPLRLQADAVRLTQVFANLLNNAAKYTAPGGKIRVRMRCQGHEAIIVVHDNGIGIPAEMLGDIFDLFTQVDGADGQARGGLGIGLTLVRNIVGMHGGRVEAHSEGRGCGSEFHVMLPLGVG